MCYDKHDSLCKCTQEVPFRNCPYCQQEPERGKRRSRGGVFFLPDGEATTTLYTNTQHDRHHAIAFPPGLLDTQAQFRLCVQIVQEAHHVAFRRLTAPALPRGKADTIHQRRQNAMKLTIEDVQAYLFDHYCNGGIDQSLFMKLVEEIGEVAEVLNKKAGRKAAGDGDLKAALGNELADVLHYTLAIASLNGLDMSDILIQKDRAASVKYHHRTTLEQFVSDRHAVESTQSHPV